MKTFQLLLQITKNIYLKIKKNNCLLNVEQTDLARKKEKKKIVY